MGGKGAPPPSNPHHLEALSLQTGQSGPPLAGVRRGRAGKLALPRHDVQAEGEGPKSNSFYR